MLLAGLRARRAAWLWKAIAKMTKKFRVVAAGIRSEEGVGSFSYAARRRQPVEDAAQVQCGAMQEHWRLQLAGLTTRPVGSFPAAAAAGGAAPPLTDDEARHGDVALEGVAVGAGQLGGLVDDSGGMGQGAGSSRAVGQERGVG
jgi:hypothetical protein